MASSLYICYFGISEPLVQTQVLPYLRELRAGGHDIALVTFEPSDPDERTIKTELTADGIDWYWRRYHKRLSVLATAWDVFIGILFVSKFINRFKPNILHARVHVPMLMAAVARRASRGRPKILFDIRGFFPEEYVDAGVWTEGGWLYRTTKQVEKWLMKEADGFVVLTDKAREILFPDAAAGRDAIRRPVEVIPCCVDAGAFAMDDATRIAVRESIGADDRYVIVYTGSFGGWYLSDEMYELFAAPRETDPQVFIMVLTQRDVENVRDRLLDRGFSDKDVFVATVSPAEIPRYLSAADAAVSFIKPCYSKQASSPTKNAEYLAAGLPMIVNSGVGDVDELIATENVGVLVDTFDHESYLAATTAVRSLGDIRDRCRAVARRRFDMAAIGGERYKRVYERMTAESER